MVVTVDCLFIYLERIGKLTPIEASLFCRWSYTLFLLTLWSRTRARCRCADHAKFKWRVAYFTQYAPAFAPIYEMIKITFPVLFPFVADHQSQRMHVLRRIRRPKSDRNFACLIEQIIHSAIMSMHRVTANKMASVRSHFKGGVVHYV
jgi:hypothetical protein